MKKFVLILMLVLLVGCGNKKTVSVAAPISTRWQDNFEITSSMEKSQNVAYVNGVLKNKSDRSFRYVQIEINFYDLNGAVVGSTMTNMTNLDPGRTWIFKAMGLQKDIARFEIKGVTAY